MATNKAGSNRRATCKECGKHRDKVGQMSRAGYCADCGYARMLEVHAQMQLKRGEYWERFQRGVEKRSERYWAKRARQLRGDG